MPATYEPIATTTLTSAATSYTFSSIPSTYTDLVLIVNSTVATVNNSTYLQFNGDTATNYSVAILTSGGVKSTRFSNINTPYIQYYSVPGTSTNPDVVMVHFNNYANTTTYKTFIARSSHGSYGTEATIATWRNTAAINSIKIIQPTYNFNIGSMFTIYGIKAA